MSKESAYLKPSFRSFRRVGDSQSRARDFSRRIFKLQPHARSESSFSSTLFHRSDVEETCPQQIRPWFGIIRKKRDTVRHNRHVHARARAKGRSRAGARYINFLANNVAAERVGGWVVRLAEDPDHMASIFRSSSGSEERRSSVHPSFIRLLARSFLPSFIHSFVCPFVSERRKRETFNSFGPKFSSRQKRIVRQDR